MSKKYIIDEKDYEKLLRCVHCGYCLTNCPTYKLTDIETASTRGRLALMRNFADSKIPLSANFIKQINMCLQCRACETNCPAGVEFGKLMETYRTIIFTTTKQSFILKFILKHVFPFPKRMSFTAKLLKYYQRTGLHFLLQKIKILGFFSKTLEIMNAMLPKMPSKFFNIQEITPSKKEKKGQVAFFSGCINPLFFPKINYDTVSLLLKSGYDVIVPPSQVCCGALHIHTGDQSTAKELAKKNIDIFLNLTDTSAIIVNAAGCGSTMKGYKELLKEDKEYSQKAKIFSDKVKDITEFLANIESNLQFKDLNTTVTFQDPCHLYHAQKIKEEPRILLRKIPGLKLIEMKNHELCCGSAGIYNITNTSLSMLLLEEKMQQIRLTKANLVLTANPGCLIQLKFGIKYLRLPIEVKHIVEILNEAMIE